MARELFGEPIELAWEKNEPILKEMKVGRVAEKL
jgi:hypothetical protein